VRHDATTRDDRIDDISGATLAMGDPSQTRAKELTTDD
jgi:hypothetical protein